MSEDPRWLRQYGALAKVVDYLDRSVLELLPPNTRAAEGQWLNQIFRMKQCTLNGPEVSRSIFSPSVNVQPSTLPEVLRQITWMSDEDSTISRDRTITWPTVATEYYELSDDEWPRVNLALRKLEGRLGHLPLDAPGLALTHPDYEAPPLTRGYEVAARGRYARALYAPLSWVTISANFHQGYDFDLDEAWDAAWDALSQICQHERRVDGYEATYLIPPERLSELLTRAVSEPP